MPAPDSDIEGAKRCLVERGWANTPVRDIAAAAGVRHAAIGYHFGSRERLLVQAQRNDELRARLAEGQQRARTELGGSLALAVMLGMMIQSLIDPDSTPNAMQTVAECESWPTAAGGPHRRLLCRHCPAHRGICLAGAPLSVGGPARVTSSPLAVQEEP